MTARRVGFREGLISEGLISVGLISVGLISVGLVSSLGSSTEREPAKVPARPVPVPH